MSFWGRNDEYYLIAARKKLADAEVAEYKAKILLECRDDFRHLEHEYHQARETKGIELAKIIAEIETKKGMYEKMLAEKDKTIEQLTKVISELGGSG